MKLSTLGVLTACAITVAACGANRQDRALGGAAIGMVSGAAVGAFSGPVGAGVGAGVGAVLGGVAGYYTQQRDIDLGPPLWR